MLNVHPSVKLEAETFHVPFLKPIPSTHLPDNFKPGKYLSKLKTEVKNTRKLNGSSMNSGSMVVAKDLRPSEINCITTYLTTLSRIWSMVLCVWLLIYMTKARIELVV